VKHTLVTALSVVGVIGAGSAAVLANTTVFTDVARPHEAITISATVPPTESTLATAPAAESSAETPASSSVPPDQAPLAAGEAGTVQVTAVDGVITVGNVEPTAGWAVQSMSGPGNWVVVQFVKDTQLVVFNAFMVDGQVQTQVDSSVDGEPVETPLGSVGDPIGPLPLRPPRPPMTSIRMVRRHRSMIIKAKALARALARAARAPTTEAMAADMAMCWA